MHQQANSMATAKRTKSNSRTTTESDSARSGVISLILKEGALLALLLIAVFLGVALLSYNPQDPGWSSVGYEGDIRNLMGASGAWFADLSFSLVGLASYLIPLLLIHRAYLIFKDRYVPMGFDMFSWALKISGSILFLIGAMCLLAASKFATQTGLPFDAGGYLGKLMIEPLQASFNLLGAVLFSFVLMLFGLTLFAEVSWILVLERTGQITTSVMSWLSTHASEWLERNQEVIRAKLRERQQKAQASQERLPVAVADPIEEKEEQASISARLGELIPAKLKGQHHADDSSQSGVKIEVVEPAQKPKPVKKKALKKINNAELGLPNLDLLDPPDDNSDSGYTQQELEDFSQLLELKLLDFGIKAEVKSVMPGPVITRFEIQPAPGVKVSRISNLVKDLARSLAVVSVRVVEVIPGKPFVGVEIPNQQRAMVFFSEVLSSDAYADAKSPLTLALGHDIAGEPIVADLAKMPHLLVAGTTGSGKSVGVNAMLLSLLYKATPAEVRLILIDPKMLELNVYEGIPHLLAPVITDMKDAANGLRWCVAEMERRYRLMAALGVRNLAGFNKKVAEAEAAGEPIADPLWQPDPLSMVDVEDQIPPDLIELPFIVVVIDEFADMMMIVGKKVEQLIARIAQKARAAGIHLVLATQRPSVDVITGLIKANVPTRIGFQVSSRVDSRTILDQGGAEQLLGHGDMLYLPPGSGMPIRVHGAFVSDDEVHRVTDDWRSRSEPDYIPGVTDGVASEEMGAAADLNEEQDKDSEQDALYDEAVAFVTESRKASISAVQRKLRIGYNRAARMVEAMEAAGVVSEMQSNGQREVIAAAPPR